MAKNALAITPEGLEVANTYLENGNDLDATASALATTREKVVDTLNKSEVKRYIDQVYLDSGYRNRHKLGSLMDRIIESKLEEAEETEMFSNKDLVDILTLAHKMRMDEIKAQKDAGTNIRSQTNVQINDAGGSFGEGNYGKLMENLFNGNKDTDKV